MNQVLTFSIPDLAAEREGPGARLQLVAVWGAGPGVIGAPALNSVDNAALAAWAATPAAILGKVPELADGLRVHASWDGVGAWTLVEASPWSGERAWTGPKDDLSLIAMLSCIFANENTIKLGSF